MAEFRSAQMELSIARVQDDMAEALRRLSWPSEPGERVKVIQERLYCRLRDFLTRGQVKRLWHREWIVPAHIYLEVMKRVEAYERETETIGKRVEAHHARVWALCHQSMDQEFYRETTVLGGGEAQPLVRPSHPNGRTGEGET